MKIDSLLYFDHQATTPVGDHILAKMLPYYRESFGNPHSSEHYLGWISSDAVEHAAAQVAHLVGADHDEIIFTSGATEANNLALLGLAQGRQLGSSKRRLLVSSIEHTCILEIGRHLEKDLGVRVDLLPVDSDGRVKLQDLERLLDDDVLAVSIMAVNNEVGTIQDIREISKLVRSSGALFHCDAAQAPLAVDMHRFATEVDLLSLSAHKMYGPKGVGALYIRRDIHSSLNPIIYGGHQQGGLRPGTLPTPLCVGMGAAAEFMASAQANEHRENLRQCRNYFAQKLAKLCWRTTINGPDEQFRHPGNLSVCFHGFSAPDILQMLQPHLCASTGSACTSGIPEPSHVLKAIGRSTSDADSSIRFSLGFDSTRENVDEAVSLISEVLDNFPDMVVVGENSP